jgi:DNA-binding SARP family transcriptional activator/Tfp pilus assembly protein PilF
MPAGTEFLLLGPLVVRADGSQVEVTAAKQRAILAALLLRANQAVPADDLAETLWGEDLPSAARAGVQNYVMRLRKALGPAGARIITEPGAYLIRVQPGDLDLHRFEDLLREARTAAQDGRWQVAADHVSAALALWRGEPLADVGSDLLRARAGPRLAELRLQALETRLDADLHLGRPGEVIAELRQLAAEHPLRERFHALLMLALYRDGRPGEALAAYQHARGLLVDELGAEPGPELRQLHQQILTADPALVQPASDPAGPTPARPAPRELPGDVAAFTGRAAELAELDRLLLGQADPPPGGRKPTAAVISAVSGTAGVGKTALAIHWAHHAAGKFPDGQLYVNLRGYDPDRPMAAADALAAFLRSLGVPGQDIPPDEAERASRYRSLLTGKRMLVVLDNAATVEQVRPLLPGTPGCGVVVTSRDSLAGLVARDGARRLDLDLLPLADAVALLRELIGTRADAQPDAAVKLAELCARLPLALRVAAELATTRADVPLADLAAELADEQQRLDLLQAGDDPRTAVRAVFAWSYQHLDPDPARTFRLAGLHPGADFEPYAVAALTGTSLEESRRTLEVLVRAHLLQAAGRNRYSMHDLLRAYARDRAAKLDGEDGMHVALTRLLDHYLQGAAAAMDILHPAERDRRPVIGMPVSPTAPKPDRATALTWLDTELGSFAAVTAHAAEHGWTLHATQIAGTLARYLDCGAWYAEAWSIHSHAQRAASQAGDRPAEARALNALGTVVFRLADYAAASEYFRQAADIFREKGDRASEGRTLQNLGMVHYGQGSYEAANDLLQRALALHRSIGDRSGQAVVLDSLGTVARHQGRFEVALSNHQQALALSREAGDPLHEATTLAGLGAVWERRNRHPQALHYYESALTLFRQVGDRANEARMLASIGSACLQQGRYQQATDHLTQALEFDRKSESKLGEIQDRICLGEVLLAVAQPGQAQAHYTAAAGLAALIGDKYEQARALNGLGRAFHATGDSGDARQQWHQALALFAELGTPEADEVRSQLSALDSDERVGA